VKFYASFNAKLVRFFDADGSPRKRLLRIFLFAIAGLTATSLYDGVHRIVAGKTLASVIWPDGLQLFGAVLGLIVFLAIGRFSEAFVVRRFSERLQAAIAKAFPLLSLGYVTLMAVLVRVIGYDHVPALIVAGSVWVVLLMLLAPIVLRRPGNVCVAAGRTP
jgi:hypothetical protein